MIDAYDLYLQRELMYERWDNGDIDIERFNSNCHRVADRLGYTVTVQGTLQRRRTSKWSSIVKSKQQRKP